jgi:hypothetical membrane protein
MATGMLAVILYAIHVICGGFLWKGYSHLQQPISDLTATGAPNRALLLSLTTLYGILALLFALSFTVAEGRKHSKLVLVGGIFFVLLHLVSLSYGLFPQDLPGEPVTFRGTMHIVVTALIVPFTILTPLLTGFGFTREPAWRAFGIYSIATGLLILVFGGTTAYFYLHRLPYFGLVERINIGTLQVWTFALSLKLTWKR